MRVANKIYIVAGERNMRLAPTEGGLYANVGQTTRSVADRLRDDDYKRKAAGGKWQVLLEQEVGDLTTDKQIHPLLKRHPDVSWDPDSDNTEEFFFRGDPGDGSVARLIVGGILQQICLPHLQQENARLTGDIAQLGEEIAKRDEIIRSISSGEMVQRAMSRFMDASKENDELRSENERLKAERTSSIFERQSASRINEENRRLRQWHEEEKRAHARVKSELDTLKNSTQRRRHDTEAPTPMWLWAIPLALLSYCGGCTRAESKWEDTLSREQLAEKHHYAASWREDATPEKVENELISQWKYASDLVEQNSRLKAQIQEHTAAREKEQADQKSSKTTFDTEQYVNTRRKARGLPPLGSSAQGATKTAPPKVKGITFPHTCQSLDRQCSDYGAGCYTNCEGGGRIIRVWGDGLYGSVTLERVGGSIVATDSEGRKVVSIR